MELEELEAYLDPSFSPEGWLDKEPSPPKKKLKFAAPVASDKLCDAAIGIVLKSTEKKIIGKFSICSFFAVHYSISIMSILNCCFFAVVYSRSVMTIVPVLYFPTTMLYFP